MWPVSDAFLTAHRAPAQRVTCRAELWAGGSLAATLAVVGGSVSIDGRRATRRTITCDLIDPLEELVPANVHDILVPTGVQLRVWRGIVLPSGAVEEAPLGVFRVTEPSFDLSAGGGLTISLTGSDEGDTVRQARLTSAWTVAAGQPVGAAIGALLADRHPSLPFRDDTSSGVTVGATVIVPAGADSDPWQAAMDIAAQHGMELIIDAVGTAVVRPIPADTDPVVTYERGPEAVLTTLSRKLTTEQTYSGVVVSSETSDAEGGGLPIQVELWDTDPASPTYYLGSFGKRPYFVTSAMITTAAQATSTAAAHLPKVTGILENVQWEQIANPALDAGDVIALRDDQLRMDALLTVEALTIPLTSTGTMSAVTRSREMRAWIPPETEISPGGEVPVTPPPEAAASWTANGLPLDGQVLFGAAMDGSGAATATAFETLIGAPVGVRRSYFGSGDLTTAVATATDDLAHGRIPWVSFKTPYNGASNNWSRMAAGDGDAWAASIAAALGALDGPVWLAIHHEPENEPDGTAVQWKAMQQRLAPIFKAQPSIAYTAILMGWHEFYGTMNISDFYPGDAYCDILGLDMYQFYSTQTPTVWSWSEMREYCYQKVAAWKLAAGSTVRWALAETGYSDAASVMPQNGISGDGHTVCSTRGPGKEWLLRTYQDMQAAGGSAVVYFNYSGFSETRFVIDSGTPEKIEIANAVATMAPRWNELGTSPPTPATPTFVASWAASPNNGSTVNATIPSSAQVGDVMLAFAAFNAASTLTPPAGLTQIGSTITDASVRSAAFHRVIQAGDAGTVMTFTTSGTSKTVVTLYVARAVTAIGLVSASTTQTGTPTDNTQPSPAATGTGLTVHFLAEKTSTPATDFTAPAGATIRDATYNTSSGATCGAVADRGVTTNPAAGTWGGCADSTDAIAWTVILPAATS